MEAVLRTIKSTGALVCGFVSYARVAVKMDAGLRARAEAENPELQNLLVAAYAYDGAAGPGNLSLYARGEDYHDVVKKRLSMAGGILRARYKGRYFHPYTDTSPFPEVYAAACAGLGVIGKNGLLITQQGSYVFIGILATDLPMTDPLREPDTCAACDLCLRSCPTGALSADGLDAERCLSAITQRRGALQQWEQTAVRRAGLIWGCDVCQTCCPLNRGCAAPLAELRPEISSLTAADVALSDAEFREKFTGRAFIWRGVQPLRRNLTILEEDARTLLDRAFSLFDVGRAEEAAALYAVCEEELPERDPLRRTLWMGRGYVRCELGNFAAAAADFQKLYDSAASLEDRQIALHQQGMAARRADDLNAAEGYFARELALIDQLPPSPLRRANNGYERGYIALRRGDLDGSEKLLLLALRDARAAKDPVALGCVNRVLAELAFALGRLPTARKRLARARSAFHRAGDLRGEHEIDVLRVELLGPDPEPDGEETEAAPPAGEARHD